MNAVVVDASAGIEIILATRRGRALARLVPADAVQFVPEHFTVEVLGGLRRLLLVEHTITAAQAATAVDRQQRWHLRQVSVHPLAAAAWGYRDNIAMADAFYVALAEQLGAALLTDDHRLVAAPTFPNAVDVLSLPKPTPPSGGS